MNVNNLLQFFQAEEEIKLCRVNIKNSNGVFNMYKKKKGPDPNPKKTLHFFYFELFIFLIYRVLIPLIPTETYVNP